MIIRRLSALLLLAGSVGIMASSYADEEILTKKDEDRRDLTMLRRVTESTFVHEASRIAFTIPTGWKEIRPQRLTRKIEPRTSTAMGIEIAERDVVATMYWLPLGTGAKFDELIRETEVGGEYGEEYETLKTVYGKENVTVPEKKTYNGRTAYRVNVRGGPDRGEKYDGTLFLFEVTSTEGRWLIKVRVSYPKGERPNTNERYAEEVINAYSDLADTKKSDLPKVPELPKPVEEKK